MGIAANLSVAMTLLGSVSFMMGIFYLVNHPDSDMQLYSWEVVSCTVSIFVAILFFHGLLGVTHIVTHDIEHAYDLDPGFAHTVVHTTQAVILFASMHCLMCLMSTRAVEGTSPDAGDDRALRRSMSRLRGGDESAASALVANVEGIAIERRQDLVCGAVLSAHMASFAAIHAGGAMQHWILECSEPDRFRGPLLSLSALIFLLALFLVLFRASDLIRTCLFSGKGRILEVWDEIAEEAENEIASLALSFLIVQAVRYLISGYFPGPEGSEHDHLDHGILCCLLLFGASFAFVGMRIVLVAKTPDSPDEHEASLETGITLYLARWVFIAHSTIAMCFAWCLLYSTMWWVSRQLVQWDLVNIGFGPNSAAVRSIVAILISIIAFLSMWMLDKCSDARAGDSAEKAMRGIIRSFGVLVGFSWEQAFAGGIEAVVEASVLPGMSRWYPVFIQAGIALLLGLGVVPAWKMYILKTLLELRERQEKKEHGQDDKAGSVLQHPAAGARDAELGGSTIGNTAGGAAYVSYNQLSEVTPTTDHRQSNRSLELDYRLPPMRLDSNLLLPSHGTGERRQSTLSSLGSRVIANATPVSPLLSENLNSILSSPSKRDNAS